MYENIKLQKNNRLSVTFFTSKTDSKRLKILNEILKFM